MATQARRGFVDRMLLRRRSFKYGNSQISACLGRFIEWTCWLPGLVVVRETATATQAILKYRGRLSYLSIFPAHKVAGANLRVKIGQKCAISRHIEIGSVKCVRAGAESETRKFSRGIAVRRPGNVCSPFPPELNCPEFTQRLLKHRCLLPKRHLVLH